MEATRTRAAQEARRRLAVRKVDEGRPPADVADFLGVHVETVREWVRAHRAAGDDGPAGKPHPGRAPYPTPDQERRVLGWVADKPTAHGFPTDLWTARRVAHLIRQKFGVEFHPGDLREWPSSRNPSPQEPANRAQERDPAAVGRWPAEGGPAVQKERPTSGPTSS